jgi:hypothetical protein
MDPVRLRGTTRLLFTAGQNIRIIETEDPEDPRGPLKIETVRYFYVISTTDQTEILAFHWTPEAIDSSTRTFPHLHIGQAITTSQTALRPRTLHKAHIPTGRVSLESVIYLLITEFQVKTLRRNWRRSLERSEQAFMEWKTR